MLDAGYLMPDARSRTPDGLARVELRVGRYGQSPVSRQRPYRLIVHN